MKTTMLTVYTFPVPKPLGCFDMSAIPLDQLADTVRSILTHQTTGHIWFGYLDGWMLTPREEVLIRPVVRAFPCSLVTRFPLSLSQSWKNEIDVVHTDSLHHASSISHNDGGSLHDGGSVQYGHSCTLTASQRKSHQN